MEFLNGIVAPVLQCTLHIVIFYFLLRILDVAKAGGRLADAFWITRRIIDITPNGDVPEKEDDDVKTERSKVACMDISLMPKVGFKSVLSCLLCNVLFHR